MKLSFMVIVGAGDQSTVNRIRRQRTTIVHTYLKNAFVNLKKVNRDYFENKNTGSPET